MGLGKLLSKTSILSDKILTICEPCQVVLNLPFHLWARIIALKIGPTGIPNTTFNQTWHIKMSGRIHVSCTGVLQNV